MEHGIVGLVQAQYTADLMVFAKRTYQGRPIMGQLGWSSDCSNHHANNDAYKKTNKLRLDGLSHKFPIANCASIGNTLHVSWSPALLTIQRVERILLFLYFTNDVYRALCKEWIVSLVGRPSVPKKVKLLERAKIPSSSAYKYS